MAKQHNQLVQVPLPPSPYEHSIFTLLLASLTADIERLPQVIRIPVKEVAGTDNLNSTHCKLIEKACRALFARAVSLRPPNATKGSLSLVHIVQDIQYVKDTGYIEASFADKIVPYLLQFKQMQVYLVEQKPAHAVTECELLSHLLEPESFSLFEGHDTLPYDVK